MNILIIGEYSGFAKNLKTGLEHFGHHIVIFQEGDGWKNIDTGSNSHRYSIKNFEIYGFVIKKTWVFSSISNIPRFVKDISKYQNYFDIVFIINYEFIRLNYEFWLSRFSINDIKKVLKKDGKIFMSACGDDYAYLKNVKNFKYSAYQNTGKHKFLSKRRIKLFRKVISYIEGIIPVMYDYAQSYRNLDSKFQIKLLPTIPLPLNMKDIVPHNEIKDKIVIFHGLNRDFKGTEIIVKALENIKKKYPDKVEIIIDGKMPLSDYLKLLQRTNIVVDQCYSYSYGMNAIYSMAMGKVVLSGNEPECAEEFGVESIPIINILPDADDIEKKIEKLILDRNYINKLSKDSVIYSKSFHDCDIIAKKYISIFSN